MCRLERRGPDLDARETQQVGRKRPDGTRAEHQRALELPGLPVADRTGVTERALADRRRLGEDTEPAQRPRNRDELAGIFDDQLAREPVQPCDPALDVVARQARIGEAVRAGETVPAGTSHGRGDEVAPREAMAVALDQAEQLVTEHELRAVGRCDAEEPM